MTTNGDGDGGSTKLGSESSRDTIPEPFVEFIQDHVSSLEELEVLLLLRASAPREWRAEEVCRTVGSSLRSIEIRLERLTQMRLLAVCNTEPDRLYRYAPDDPRAALLIDGVARLYKERRLSVIDLLYGHPERESDIQAFSDAFKLRKAKGA